MAAHELHETAQALVADGKGILAADESGGTIKKRFDSIGVESTEENRRAYRDLLFTTPGAEEYISGVILFDETIRQSGADGTPFPKLLESKGIIPGIKVDKGAKPLALARARRSPRASTGCASGSPSTTSSARASRSGARPTRSATTLPSDYCIWANAHALARYAALCQEAGIVPIVEPEVLHGRRPLDRAQLRRHLARARTRSSPSCTTSASTSSGTLLKPNMVLSGYEASGPRRRRGGGRADARRASTGTCRRRCPGSSSSPAASRTRTRPRT